ncbi:hypothetical protein BKA69DRAFT_515840 [Paraphysoderma sedebokerense]|nr:hypothetical protein BKA69DRAFT_515840 [Paraphysoderma sedebokerense]
MSPSSTVPRDDYTGLVIAESEMKEIMKSKMNSKRKMGRKKKVFVVDLESIISLAQDVTKREENGLMEKLQKVKQSSESSVTNNGNSDSSPPSLPKRKLRYDGKLEAAKEVIRRRKAEKRKMKIYVKKQMQARSIQREESGERKSPKKKVRFAL